MSRLEELIQQHCPDGVEYKKLGDVCLMERGTSATKGTMQEGDIPVISGGRQPAFYCSQSNRTGETITVAGSGAGAGYVQYWDKPIFVCDAFSIKGNDSLNTKYIYYFLTSIQEKIYATKKGGGVPHVHISSIDKFVIPVPPLPVQEEIVRILDTLTELQAELQAELQKRLQQYNYYRDKLLSFNDLNGGGYAVSVEWKKLGDIATLIRGGNFQKKDFTDSGVPCIHYGQIYTHFGIHTTSTLKYISPDVASKSKIAKTNDIVMAITSENVEDVGKCVAWMGDEDIAVSGHTAIIQHKQNAKYLSYYFHSSHFFTQKKRLAHGTKVIEISPKDLANVVIPIPPLAEQQRIVDILDRFDKLTNDITEGLPAEIEARRKQYEYYRDQLLTFKQKA